MSASSQHPLISFFEGTDTDPFGRYLRDILKWSDRELERSHDYIQTLFPLPEASNANFYAELVDKTVFEAFRLRGDLQGSLRAAFTRILSFYGFEMIFSDGNKPMCRKLKDFNTAAENWVRKYDHNHLRITRIIRSLRILGFEDSARAFYLAVKEVQAQSSISDISLMYWSRAMERPLNISPDVREGEEHSNMGPRFLREFVSSQRPLGRQTDGNGDDEEKQVEKMAKGVEDSAAARDGREVTEAQDTNVGRSFSDPRAAVLLSHQVLRKKALPTNVGATSSDLVAPLLQLTELFRENQQSSHHSSSTKIGNTDSSKIEVATTKTRRMEAEESAPSLTDEILSPFNNSGEDEHFSDGNNDENKDEQVAHISTADRRRKEAVNEGLKGARDPALLSSEL